MNETPSRRTVGRITRLELIVAAAVAAVLLLLVLIEPEILEAPFENGRTILFTVGGTVLAAIAFVAMLRYRVPAIVRLVVLLVPFAIVNWWLISPYFIDDVVDEAFSTSIAEQLASADEPSADQPAAPATPTNPTPTTPSIEEEPTVDTTPPTTEAPPPNGPALLGAGSFVGLAGHSGTGDAGIFENPDGSLVLRFENFDIQNGPDLEVYLVPGADQTSLADGAIHLGALKGNVGDQSYELAPGTELAAGPYTALVWCEAFTVEFVGATISI
ncbi:MAG: DM13 domain-containing protein [Acidimicrobiales bacterium]